LPGEIASGDSASLHRVWAFADFMKKQLEAMKLGISRNFVATRAELLVET
jgi:hypothetical protein